MTYRRPYTQAEKGRFVLRALMAGFRNLEEVAAFMGVHPSTVRRWIRAYWLDLIERAKVHCETL